MAATDKPFRDQHGLDIVFGVSNILMLLAVFWMFWQDYAREYKVDQRAFRQVEVAVAQQQAMSQLPDEKDFMAALDAVKKARENQEKNEKALLEARAEKVSLKPQKERTEAAYQGVKAKVDSITSFLDQAREFNDESLTKKYEEELFGSKEKQTKGLYGQLAEAQAERDLVVDKIKFAQFKIDDIEEPYTKATAKFKQVNDKLDAQVKLALTKRWTWQDWFRTMPVINGFADPLKIHQFTINDIPIDYNFKYVTRFDRCTTCHLGIDRPNFTRENLLALTKDNPDFKAKLETADKLYDIRVGKDTAGQDAKGNPLLDPTDIAAARKSNPHDITPVNVKDLLTRARITEFAAHPRLDLFVGSNSKHPAEKFGCSSCHYGQGSGTSFVDSSHSPNNAAMRAEWAKERGWEPAHMWDFPMLPNRFIESSCIKCHHEVTDLISTDNRVEAPKLIKGYNLIKENGCFGCHEISGWKGANRVGPDLRLEPSPPLEDMLPLERVKAENDPDNRPGTMRKVGPALSRVSEKLTEEFVKKWIASPRSFRTDTKMPHYYGLSTNNEEFLKVNAPGQEKFPNTEIASIGHFLMKTSKDYLSAADKQHGEDAKSPQNPHKDVIRLTELLNLPRMSPEQQDEYKAIKARMKLRKETKLVDLAPDYKGDKDKGRTLFTERGCLACHSHNGTEQLGVSSDALFGPNITDIAGKLVPNALDHPEQLTNARKWLIQWIVDPHVHSPRSRMPVTHLTPQEAADIAAWLFSQAPNFPAAWIDVKVSEPAKLDLQELAKVYLTRMLSKSDMEVFLKGMSDEQLAKFRKDPKNVSDEWRLILGDVAEDEKTLITNDVRSEESLKFYLGKKAVSRLGCYGCHDIPGFESAKSIGVGLNDWGKKPADRLAFEDIHNFFNAKYFPVDSARDRLVQGKIAEINDKSVKIADTGAAFDLAPDCKFYAESANGKEPINGVNAVFLKIDGGRSPAPASVVTDPNNKVIEIVLTPEIEKKEPYEKFYASALLGHPPERLGYLNQKLRDPRSYDFNRIRTWDDRARMPQFQFSRPRREQLSDPNYNRFAEEAAAREAVATFVLGLVAEQVPVKSINTPKGDRLAEVKGRQIIDKYNCAGCHLIRPGSYDFKLDPKSKTLPKLDFALGIQNQLVDKLGITRFPNHINWEGRNPLGGERITAHGVFPRYTETVNEDEVKEAWLVLTLSEALRYTDDKGAIKNLPSSTPIFIAMSDLVANPAEIQSEADLNRHFASVNPLGGAFSNLLVPYLNRRDPKKFPLSEGDSAEARASLPPVLIGQGERTQPEWLAKFLLDPQPIRKLAILRMPKFNMSKEEAAALVDYFAGVTKQTNPGVALPFPFESLPEQADLDGPYWRQKTKEYVERLKKMPARDSEGKLVKDKDGKELTAYQQRLQEYAPIWEKLAKETEKGVQADLDKLAESVKSRNADLEAKEKALKKADKGKEADLQKEIDALKASLKEADAEKTRLEGSLKKDAKAIQKEWEEKDAYAADAYRMLTSRKLCLQCHQVGNFAPSEKDKQGPPLALANQRLRPEWIVQWVNQPQRFVPYSSLMPTYFSDKEWKWQPIHAGTNIEQIHAIRDTLLNFPRLSELPINRLRNPDEPEKK